jgi:hypothetical protein
VNSKVAPNSELAPRGGVSFFLKHTTAQYRPGSLDFKKPRAFTCLEKPEGKHFIVIKAANQRLSHSVGPCSRPGTPI